MKKLFLFLSGFLALSNIGHAQVVTATAAGIVIGTNTSLAASPGTVMATDGGISNRSKDADFSEIDITLTGSKGGTLATLNLLRLHGLTVDSDATFTISGNWLISDNFTLTKGKLFVPPGSASAGTRLLYSGANDITTGSDISYVDGLFFMAGKGPRTFPIGNADGYFPAVLTNVNEDNVLLGFEVKKGDPAATYTNFSQLPSQVTALFKEHYWERRVRGTDFTGSYVQLSFNGLDAFTPSDGSMGAPVILEADTLSSPPKSLEGSLSLPFVKSSKLGSTKSAVYAIGKIDKLPVPLVINVITPTADDNKNNVLQIENIDFYPVNTVTLIDRWGVPVKSWSNFKNNAGDYDFGQLAIGNYICVVEYTTGTGEPKQVSQMISVLK